MRLCGRIFDVEDTDANQVAQIVGFWHGFLWTQSDFGCSLFQHKEEEDTYEV